MTASIEIATASWWTAPELVIAVYDGRGRGGTAGTLAYAHKTGRIARVLFFK